MPLKKTKNCAEEKNMKAKILWKGFKITCSVSDLSKICVECGSSFYANKEDIFEMGFSDSDEDEVRDDLKYLRNQLRIKRQKTQEELEKLECKCSICDKMTNMKIMPSIVSYMTDGDKKRRLEILNNPKADEQVKKWLRAW